MPRRRVLWDCTPKQLIGYGLLALLLAAVTIAFLSR